MHESLERLPKAKFVESFTQVFTLFSWSGNLELNDWLGGLSYELDDIALKTPFCSSLMLS